MHLNREDYEEPRCLLNMHPETQRIPVKRVTDRLDVLLGKKDYDGAVRLLDNWAREARDLRDSQGELSILNEQIGLYRKLDKKPECLNAIEGALKLLEELQMEDTVTGGTTLVNAATGYKAAGEPLQALPLYRRAREIYEKRLEEGDDRLAALYNNMALALAETGEYGEAAELYEKAIGVLQKKEGNEPEIAITYLNMADLLAEQEGCEAAAGRIDEFLDRAEQLLDSETIPRNGYYAFVCEKCAPGFYCYGHFSAGEKLEKRAEEIYERA